MGVHPFADLPRVLDDRTKEMVRLVTGIVQEAYMQAVGYAALGTPVDTGEARSNWIPSKNTPVVAQRPPFAPGDKLGQTENANFDAVMADTRRVSETFDALTDQSLHSTNSLDYILRLNYTDHSPQAEPGFFDRAIPFAAQKVRGKWRLAP